MIHVENLTKYYGEFCAVKGINFSVDRSEVVGLLGPNGAGKTTTLRMLTGYLLPTEGTISVKEYVIPDDIVAIKGMIGYLPESAPLYNEMLVYDYLDYVAGIKGIEKNKRQSHFEKLVFTCGLQNIMHLPIGELSKGLKQRVGLAHAMMNDPEILILDEPTSGLDPNQITDIRSIITEIGKEKTVILSTHILSEVEATCDRIIIINEGTIVADKPTAALKQSVGSNTRDTIVTVRHAGYDDIEAAVKDINGVTTLERLNAPDGDISLRVVSAAEIDIRPALYERIKSRDWILMEFYQEQKTLETIFRELTKEM